MKEPIVGLVAGAIAVTAGGGASIAAEGWPQAVLVALAVGAAFTPAERSHRDIRGGALRIGWRKLVLAEALEVERDRPAHPLPGLPAGGLYMAAIRRPAPDQPGPRVPRLRNVSTGPVSGPPRGPERALYPLVPDY